MSASTKSQAAQDLERIEELRREVARQLARATVLVSDEIGEEEAAPDHSASPSLRRLARHLRNARFVLDCLGSELRGFTRIVEEKERPVQEGGLQ